MCQEETIGSTHRESISLRPMCIKPGYKSVTEPMQVNYTGYIKTRKYETMMVEDSQQGEFSNLRWKRINQVKEDGRKNACHPRKMVFLNLIESHVTPWYQITKELGSEYIRNGCDV